MTDQRITKDKFVAFTYEITDESGALVERIDIPVDHIHGANSGMFEKIEKAMEGCGAGDEVQVKLSPEEGFGPHHPEMTFTDDVENVPEQFRWVGAEVDFQNDQGDVKTFRVSRIEDGKLTVDANHPLAGRNLTFTLKVIEVRDSTPEERAGPPSPGPNMLH